MNLNNNKRILSQDIYASVLAMIKFDIFGAQPNFKSGLDWYPIYREFKIHGILGYSEKTLEYITENKIFIPTKKSQTLPQTWKKRIDEQFERTMHVLKTQDKLVHLLHENGEKFVILKGFAAASLYDDYSQRKTGDIDFLVLPERFDNINSLLLENGFELTGDRNTRHNNYEFDGVSFEMHRKFTFNATPVETAVLIDGRFYEDVEKPSIITLGNYTFPSLTPENLGLCFLVHLADHIAHCGIGLRHFLDFAAFVDNYLTDDFVNNNFGKVVKQFGLYRFAAVLTKCAIIYLGLSVANKDWCQFVSDEACENLLVYIFEKGNYGMKSREVTAFLSVIDKTNSEESFFAKLQKRGEINWKYLESHPQWRCFAWVYQLCRYTKNFFAYDNPVATYFAALRQKRILNIMINDCGITAEGFGVLENE